MDSSTFLGAAVAAEVVLVAVGGERKGPFAYVLSGRDELD